MSADIRRIAVCAMGKRPFGETAARWIAELRASGAVVLDHRAHVCRRQQVIADVNGGADIVIYLGHGRTRGWNGYQTIRKQHVESAGEPVGPIDAVLAFACNTVGQRRDEVSFGHHLVGGGWTKAYLGWPGDIPLEPGLRIANRFVSLLATAQHATVGSLLQAVAEGQLDREERDSLVDCRIVGDPNAPLIEEPASA